jgi:hypothetical protein
MLADQGPNFGKIVIFEPRVTHDAKRMRALRRLAKGAIMTLERQAEAP